jgi:hypothetical protein
VSYVEEIDNLRAEVDRLRAFERSMDGEARKVVFDTMRALRAGRDEALVERDAARAALDRQRAAETRVQDGLAREAHEARQALYDCEAERDEARAALDRVRALADDWRYKGEFGWGPWQEGHGPDIEGHIRDELWAAVDQAICDHKGMSRTGVDQTPIDDPAKVWACDNCGRVARSAS